MKAISLIVGIFFLSSRIASSECPVHDQVGNAINFLRLFKEKADSDWDYQNLNTEFHLRLHQVDNDAGPFQNHKIVFEIKEKTINGRAWFYMIEAVFDETDVLQKIRNFGKLRKYENNDN